MTSGPVPARPAHAAMGYRPAFDGLRGVAVLAVMLFHANVSWAHGGFLGVDVFFVLSGFLITRLLLEEREATGHTALGAFYLRRLLRLYPALVAVLVACAIYAYGWLDPSQVTRTWHAIVATATYHMNWVQALRRQPPFGLLEHAWSLSIEEQFYVLWPLAFLALRRLGGARAVLVGATAGAAGSALARIVLWHTGSPFERVYYGLDTHADGLLLGCALAAASVVWASTTPGRRVIPRSLRFGGVASLLAIMVAFGVVGLRSAGLASWGYPLFLAATAIIVVDVYLGGLATSLLDHPWLVAVGRVSYGLYLWHWPIFLVLNGSRLQWGFIPLTVVRLTVSGAVAAASFVVIEQPFLRLKRRLEPASRRSEPAFDQPSR